MNTYSLNNNIKYKKLIYSFIDNKLKHLILTKEDIYNINKNNKIMKSAIKINKSITEIYINIENLNYTYSNNDYYDNYDILIKVIIWFLGYSKSLKLISINNIKISNLYLEQIFNVLKFNTILEILKINSSIYLNDTIFLLDFLEKNTTLKVLSLENFIFEDIYDLSRGLSKNKTLLYLNLSNSIINNLQSLSTALTINNTLTHLNLKNIIVKDKSTIKTLFKSLKENKGLLQVNLSNSQLIDFDIYELSESIPYNTKLKYIDLSNNMINNISILLNVLKNNNTLKIVNLRNNNIQIYNQYNKIKINNALIYK